MSNRSNYSMGSGSSSLYSSYYPASGRGKGSVGRPVGKEAEVDRLTDLMVQSMENSSDPEFYGMLNKFMLFSSALNSFILISMTIFLALLLKFFSNVIFLFVFVNKSWKKTKPCP